MENILSVLCFSALISYSYSRGGELSIDEGTVDEFSIDDGERNRLLNNDKLTQSVRPSLTTERISSGYQGGTLTHPDSCQITKFRCDENFPYRSITGFCNSPIGSSQGSAYSLFRRILPNAYENGDGNTPRGQGRLPSPRAVSTRVHDISTLASNTTTHMLMQWGQFLDHDITLTPQGSHDEHLDCSHCEDITRDSRRGCLPIRIPQNDAFYNSGCMRFVRSANGNTGIPSSNNPREALNQITSFIDASNVYGSEVNITRDLRSGIDGKLRVSANNLMPQAPDQTGCTVSAPGQGCFFAGDVRNSVQNGLASMHTISVREHNKIAENLKIAAAQVAAENSLITNDFGVVTGINIVNNYDDDKIFFESRRILGAIFQRITYSEFLPVVVGRTIMDRYSITEEDFYSNDLQRTSDSYDPQCDGTLTTEFATAAFRFGHSLIDHNFEAKRSDGSSDNYNLYNNFFTPAYLHQDTGRVASMLKGACGQKSQNMDQDLHDVVRNRLFGDFDLAALNIQRGRDHGIAGFTRYYNHYAAKPGSGKLQILSNEIADWPFNPTAKEKLSAVYERADDIDLFTGIISEEPDANEGILGFVGASIIAEGFEGLKKCDRFFYSHQSREQNAPYTHFTGEQIEIIRKVKLADILCHYLPNETSLQENVMQYNEDANMFSCESRAGDDYLKPEIIKKFINFRRGSQEEEFGPVKCLSFPQCTPEGDGTSTDFGVKVVSHNEVCGSLGGSVGGSDDGGFDEITNPDEFEIVGDRRLNSLQ